MKYLSIIFSVLLTVILLGCQSSEKPKAMEIESKIRSYEKFDLPQLNKFAEQNDAFALRELGTRYISGNGVKKKPEFGFDLIRRAAKDGNAAALNTMGIAYQTGRGAKQDFILAKSYFEKAILAGSSRGHLNLANIYFDGNDNIAEDKLKALYHFEACSLLGKDFCSYILSDLYWKGDGVNKNKELAKDYAQRAINNDYLPAVGLLAAYEFGDGNFEKSYPLAYRVRDWSGDGIGAEIYGLHKYFGYATSQDFVEANYYLTNIELELSTSASVLGDMYANGLGVDQDLKAALRYYKQAKAMGDATANSSIVKLVKSIGEGEAKQKQLKLDLMVGEMQVSCEMAIQDAAIYGAKFPFLSGRPNEADCIEKTNRCAFRWGPGQLKLKNQFGTWYKSSAKCFTHNGSIASLTIDGHKIE